MARILVTERIADAGLQRLRDAGHEVDEQLDLDPAGLIEAVRGAHALVIRSATTISADVVSAGVGLIVVGRAGIGLDNVDVEAATRQGIMVVNAPDANILSAAEHTMALLLAQARNVPQAHAALRAGRWERSQWQGVEVADKTLGIIGLGRIGGLVAQRAKGFSMRVIAFDPFVSEERARQEDIELVSLEDLMAQSDFVTLHVAKTPETMGLIDADLLASAKPGLRLINVARGGIVDEQALADAVKSGHIAGAAIDVFLTEPTTESPLFELDSVVVTPHLGASTLEAQDKAGMTIAEQVLLALDGEFVPFAVNLSGGEVAETVRPFLSLAEQVGEMFASLVGQLPDQLEVEFRGEIGGYDNTLTELALLKGLLARVSDDPVSYVNAAELAAKRGCEVRSVRTTLSRDYVNVIEVRGAGRSLAATLIGVSAEPRIVMVDDHAVEVPPARFMLVIRNEDRPGMIGIVGEVIGSNKVNIDFMHIGRSPEGKGAMMVITTAEAVPPDVVEQLESVEGVVSVSAVEAR
jgi:D-3-phosphoglycerate dehydrogenase